MKTMYVYMCVSVISCVTVMPSHAVSFRSAKNKMRAFYDDQPLHSKQAAVGVPLLAIGIALESVYGGKQKEIAERVRRLKQQLGRGTNKALKKQIRTLQLQRGGHIALQVFAALSSLFGGALTISAFCSWLNSMSQPRVIANETMSLGGGLQGLPGGPHATPAVIPVPAPGARGNRPQLFQGGSGRSGGGTGQVIPQYAGNSPATARADAAEARRRAAGAAGGSSH